MMEKNIETLINWIKEEIKEIKEGINYIRNTSLPHLHTRIDSLSERITFLEGQNKIKINNQIINRWLYLIAIILIVGFSAIMGIKYIPNIFLR